MEDQVFTLTVRTGNAAMQTASDIADALGAVAAHLNAGQTDGPIWDANGNTVGRYHLSHPGSDHA